MDPVLDRALEIGRKIGVAMARDAMAEGMSATWTGLDAQDGDELISEGIEPDTEEWDVAEEAAKSEFRRVIRESR